jgi:polyhydroxyalkanoate synthesis regulator phasin
MARSSSTKLWTSAAKTPRAEDEVTRRVEGVLDRMSVPSKADIETLSEKITILSKKIEELKKV